MICVLEASIATADINAVSASLNATTRVTLWVTAVAIGDGMDDLMIGLNSDGDIIKKLLTLLES